MKALHMIAFVLLVVGGLNWGIYALWGTDIGAWLGGMDTTAAKVVYILVGLAAVYKLVTHRKDCKTCV